jgi:hypothetical protein
MTSFPQRASHATGPLLVMFALLWLPGCALNGDFGRVRDSLVNDDIHSWVGREAALSYGAPVSLYNLTENERTLRDLAFPLIEPPYNRQRWDSVLYEYGIKRKFHSAWWPFDRSAYYRHLMIAYHRSTTGRYDQLIEDIRNDVTRIGPFFEMARHVADLDRKREKSMAYVADLNPHERGNALARIGENTLTIGWVQRSLTERCAAYRYALERLVVAEPSNTAIEAERVLKQLQMRIAENQVVPMLRIAAVPVRTASLR